MRIHLRQSAVVNTFAAMLIAVCICRAQLPSLGQRPSQLAALSRCCCKRTTKANCAYDALYQVLLHKALSSQADPMVVWSPVLHDLRIVSIR